MQIKTTKAAALKAKPADENALGFGDYFTDHMLVISYDEGKGWHTPEVVPYGPIAMDPAAMCLHYAQEVFEGMKAYRTKENKILLFRPEENFKRLNLSNHRLCIPQLDEQMMMDGLLALLEVEKDWVPHAPGTSLYIRPFIIAMDPHLGVRPAHSYKFIVILSPVGAYYKEGLDPVKIYVETNYVRAVKGGTGMAKTGGNYAASIKAQAEAKDQGYTQVLWLDGVHRKYIEEVGTMNVFFVIGDEVVTPALEGSILPGITRKSVIELLRNKGIKVSERKIEIDEVVNVYKEGTLKEVFGTGTAAVISPVGHLRYHDFIMDIGGGKIGALSQELYDTLTGIQWGRLADPFGWTMEVK